LFQLPRVNKEFLACLENIQYELKLTAITLEGEGGREAREVQVTRSLIKIEGESVPR